MSPQGRPKGENVGARREGVPIGRADAFEAPSVGCTVALADVFDGVDPPPETTPEAA